MAPGLSLNGISPLGLYGLGGTGAFGSYDSSMPSSMMSGYGMGAGMGMDSSIFGMGAMNPYTAGMGLGGYGMGAMLQYPLLYGQIQAQMENNQLAHAIQMQDGMNRYGVLAHRSSDRALFEKVANNGQVQYGIDNLYQVVRKGDQDAIKRQYDEVRNFILQTYRDELNDLGTEINPIVTANEYIKRIYSTSVSAKTGQIADLETDIVRYGDGPFMNGFLQSVRKGHHGSYTDETLQYCFGRDIDEKGYKDHKRVLGKTAGGIVNFITKPLAGMAAGAGIFATGNLIAKGIGAIFKHPVKLSGRFAKVGAILGLVAGLGDAIWQITGNSKTTA